MKAIIKNKIFTQLIATLGALLLMNQAGILIGWTSPNIARLTAKNARIQLTTSEASWLASCLTLGRFISIILVPIFMELAGSKKSNLYSFVPVGVSWVMTMTAKSAMFLYIARFLSGITFGLAFGIYSIYLGEIATPKHRGMFISIALIGWPLGTLVGTIGETYLSEVVSSAIYLLPCFIGICLFAWLPESPYQLVKNEDLRKARESLDWYRGHNQTEIEMQEIIEFVEATDKMTFAERMKLLRSPAIRNAVIIVSLVYTYPQSTGILNIFFYMHVILMHGKSYLVDPNQMVIYTNVIVLVATIVTSNLVDKFGRRMILLITSTIMTLALICLGLHFYLLNNVRVDPLSIQVLPIASIIILLVTFAIGLLPVVNTLLGEMFPSSIKSTAAMIVTFCSALASCISTLAYQPSIDTYGEYCVFWTYAVFMASLIPLVLLLLPETKGKSLQEIQRVLNRR